MNSISEQLAPLVDAKPTNAWDGKVSFLIPAGAAVKANRDGSRTITVMIGSKPKASIKICVNDPSLPEQPLAEPMSINGVLILQHCLTDPAKVDNITMRAVEKPARRYELTISDYAPSRLPPGAVYMRTFGKKALIIFDKVIAVEQQLAA